MFFKVILDLDFYSIGIVNSTLILLFFSILTYAYIGLTNNDFVIFDDRVEIINRIPLFKKKSVIHFKEIKVVLFREDWTESIEKNIKPRILSILFSFMKTFFFVYFLPFDYKWIEIDSGIKQKFYCFGLEFDYYDNIAPCFEDMFDTLSELNIYVKWTD